MFALINGLSAGMAIFLVAAGLTLMFGVMRILNFAHGAFFMIGAYVAATLVGSGPHSIATLIGGAAVGGAAVGLLGLAVERVVFRRIQHVEEHFMLIATFAVMLICVGAVKLIWGLDFVSVDPPPGLDGAVSIGDLFVPQFSLFVIGAGVAVFLVLELFIHRLWMGKMIVSITADRWMANLLGLNVPVAVTLAVVASFALAGVAGGLLLPNQTLSPGLGDAYLLLGFNAVIIGGLGNVRGAFVAAILLGLIDSFNAVLLPQAPGIAVYVGMIGFLLLRPEGIFAGRRA
ncbi:branched-chain amino acid ABC transporter permease [Azospirillum soli]|uniref:branched-chain amino acid ABC transporter permease n=1 Tax=Azospirillum soli TaxID=1304799 RepID=UPI001AE973CC|nr:branched-chain amino acid ABC transporter permease [Azospirillum soli]MBP2316605.1 branched-subunit amino acid ABC-type transport system permease component [Azospirillum soli]